MNDSPSATVGRVLAERIGLDPSSVGVALIARGVHNRMAALGLRTVAEYDRALVERPEEAQALVEEEVVPESWFFRDDRPFVVLTDFAGRGWLNDPSRPPLSALSIPCASGEEPYSIAITLLEAGLAAERFRVDAVDVSARSMSRAIAGVYSPNAFRGIGSPARSGYFREQGGAFTVESVARASVRFHLGNLLDPSLFADRPPFDVVFCRNLLIYLDDEAKGRAFATLARLVAEGGLLFLGHADRLEGPTSAPFEPTGEKGAFAYLKGGAKTAKAPASTPARRASPSTPASAAVPPKIAGKPAPAARPAATIPGTAREPKVGGAAETTALTLERASILADSGRYAEATALVEGSIRAGGAGAGAYFLLGLIAQSSGDRGRAEAHFIKAIYLDPRHDEALLALALLARRKGDIAGEAAYRRRADRVLARKGDS